MKGRRRRIRLDRGLTLGPWGDHPLPARTLDLKSSIAINMLEMVGVGPFITLPLIVSAMGGPQAILGWVLGAIVAMCDGLVWAELGAAMPEAGGSYVYLREIFGERSAGRWISFLYVWQFTLSGPLCVCVGRDRAGTVCVIPVARATQAGAAASCRDAVPS